MRRIASILLVLLLAGWVATELPSDTVPIAPGPTTVWRRTRQGWEHQDRVVVPPPVHRPSLHPLVIAALEVLLTGTVMLALDRD